MIRYRSQLRSRSHRRGGFTLVEVLVTMAMMAAILPVAMRGISLAITTASTARHKAEAATLAQSKLNELTTTYLIMQDTSVVGSSGDFGEAWPGYTWASTSSDDTQLGVLQMTLTVNWLERGGQRSFELATMLQYLDTASGTTDTGTTSTLP
jgi:type II secretion system protein I